MRKNVKQNFKNEMVFAFKFQQALGTCCCNHEGRRHYAALPDRNKKREKEGEPDYPSFQSGPEVAPLGDGRVQSRNDARVAEDADSLASSSPSVAWRMGQPMIA